MSASANCFGYRLRTVGSHGRSSKGNFDKCVNDSSPTRSSKTSPTPSRSSLAALVLLTLSAAIPLAAETLTAIPTRDNKVVRRWALDGDPRGLAFGADGTLYVGLAQPQ